MRGLRMAAVLAGSAALPGCQPRPPLTGAPVDPLGDLPRREHPAADSLSAHGAFERLKALAGAWEGASVGFPAAARIEVTGRGAAVVERIVVEDPVEMTTVYHLDGARLMAVHHCAAGNHPRYYLDARSTPEALRFTLEGGANFRSAGDFHMHALDITLAGDTAAVWTWHGYREARLVESTVIELRRSK